MENSIHIKCNLKINHAFAECSESWQRKDSLRWASYWYSYLLKIAYLNIEIALGQNQG